MLQITNLKKVFNKIEMIVDANYTFDKGGVYPVIGAHSSGKTLLCECIAGLCRPDGGEIYISGDGSAIMVHEDSTLPPYLTVREYLGYMCSSEEADVACEEAGVPQEVYDHLIGACDKETRKRLQMAVVLIKKPYVIALDAPFDYCSEEFFNDMMPIIDELKDKHIIIVTSGNVDVARSLSGDVIVLNNGELNAVTDESFEIPEIRQAVIDLLAGGEDDDEIN